MTSTVQPGTVIRSKIADEPGVVCYGVPILASGMIAHKVLSEITADALHASRGRPFTQRNTRSDGVHANPSWSELH